MNVVCSDLYLSKYKDWFTPQSILEVIVVIHANIGELTHGNRSHSQILEDFVFFTMLSIDLDVVLGLDTRNDSSTYI